MTSAPAYQPAGFCPHCGYAMDAGRCPECGADVPPKRLLRAPLRSRFARHWRMTIIVALLAALAGGGHYVATHYKIIPSLPTWFLLAFQGDQPGQMTRELFRRFSNGGLSKEQSKQLLDYALRPNPRLEIPARYPAGMPLTPKLRFEWRQYPMTAPHLSTSLLAGSSWTIRHGAWEVKIDGKIIAENKNPGLARHLLYAGRREILFPLPPLEPGTHTIAVTQELFLVNPLAGPDVLQIPPTHTWTLQADATLLIEDRPLEDFVKFTVTPELRDHVEKSFSFQAARALPDCPLPPLIYMKFSGAPLPIIGETWLRPSGKGEFVRTGVVMILEPSAGWEGYLALDHLPDMQHATHLDLRLVPGGSRGLRQMLHHNLTECYGGVIEYLEIPILGGLQNTAAEMKPASQSSGAPTDGTPFKIP